MRKYVKPMAEDLQFRLQDVIMESEEVVTTVAPDQGEEDERPGYGSDDKDHS